MTHMVLGISYTPSEREAVCIKWREYDLTFIVS